MFAITLCMYLGQTVRQPEATNLALRAQAPQNSETHLSGGPNISLVTVISKTVPALRDSNARRTTFWNK
jgi:hypothetical protein